jgi:hypothetical protein
VILRGERVVRVRGPPFALGEQDGNRKRARGTRHRGERECFDAVFGFGKDFEWIEFGARGKWIIDPVRSMRGEPFRETLDDARSAVRHELGAFGREARDEAFVDPFKLAQAKSAHFDIAATERRQTRGDITDDLDGRNGTRTVRCRAVASHLKWRGGKWWGDVVRTNSGHVV